MDFEGFFSCISDGIILTDTEGKIVYMNTAAKDLLKSEDNYRGRLFNEVCPLCNFVTGESFTAPIDEVLEAKKSLGFAKNVGLRLNGKEIYLSATISPVFENGALTGVSIILRDITRIRLLELQAEEASRVKGEFLANMSHEVRTPINGFLGMVELTLRTKLTRDQRENLISAKTCATDLLQIINDILDYSKLENHKMQVEKINLDLPALLDQVERVHSRVAKDKGVCFVKSDKHKLPSIIKGDPLRLRQILNNLLTNAIKFTESGAIALNCRKIERNGAPFLRFYVTDSGIGMDYAGMKKLFKAFSQVDGSTTRKFGGTGLGLRIVKELVGLMEGEVGVASNLGRGSLFYFTIPLIEGSDDEEIFTPQPTDKKDKLSFEKKDITSLLDMCKKRLGVK